MKLYLLGTHSTIILRVDKRLLTLTMLKMVGYLTHFLRKIGSSKIKPIVKSV